MRDLLDRVRWRHSLLSQIPEPISLRYQISTPAQSPRYGFQPPTRATLNAICAVCGHSAKIGSISLPTLTLERAALEQLGQHHGCPHTSTAQIYLDLLLLESPV